MYKHISKDEIIRGKDTHEVTFSSHFFFVNMSAFALIVRMRALVMKCLSQLTNNVANTYYVN